MNNNDFSYGVADWPRLFLLFLARMLLTSGPTLSRWSVAHNNLHCEPNWIILNFLIKSDMLDLGSGSNICNKVKKITWMLAEKAESVFRGSVLFSTCGLNTTWTAYENKLLAVDASVNY